jgi:hypothetical protein
MIDKRGTRGRTASKRWDKKARRQNPPMHEIELFKEQAAECSIEYVIFIRKSSIKKNFEFITNRAWFWSTILYTTRII